MVYNIVSVTGQKVIGEPVVSGLVLNDSGLWDPDFVTAAKQESSLFIFSSITFYQLYKYIEMLYSIHFRYVMSPPIRESGHDKALQAALSNGVLQVILHH